MNHWEPALVSVITPAWNVARHIGHAITSVQEQTYGEFEMLIVDDASTDSTPEVVAGIAATDARVRLIRQQARGGPGLARAAALGAARGRYVAFLDADDTWLPEKLTRQLRFMADRNAAFSATSYRRMTERGEQVGRLIRVPERIRYRDLLKNTSIAASTVVIDRAVTGPVQTTSTFHDDFVLWLSLLKRGIDAHGLDEDLMRHRVVASSYSRGKLRMAYHVWRTYRDVERLGFADACWCFLNYAWNGYGKYRVF